MSGRGLRRAMPLPAALRPVAAASLRHGGEPASGSRRAALPGIQGGWLVVAGAFIVTMTGYGAIYSFAAFADALEAEFGASRASVSIVYALSGFTAFAASAVTGPLADRIGPRPLAASGMLLVGLGLVMAAMARTLPEIWLCYGLIIGLGVGFAYVPAIAAVQRWFVISRGLASGIAASGIGVGTALVSPSATLLTAFGDWRTAFLLCGAAATAVGLAGALLLDGPSACRRHRPDGAAWPAATAMRAPAPDGFDIAAAIRMRGFWLLYLGTLLVSVPLSLPFAHLAHSARQVGLAPDAALSLLSLLGIGTVLGRVLLGALADKVGRGATLFACCLGIGAMTLVWALAEGRTPLIAFAFGLGIVNGGFVALLPACVADRFGGRCAAGIIGVLYTGRGIALLVAAPLLAVLVERHGGYGAPLLLAGVAGLAGAVLVALGQPSRR